MTSSYAKKTQTDGVGESDNHLQDVSLTPEKQSQQQMELGLNIPKTLRTEFNFLKFPFFDLAKDSQRSKIKIEEFVETDEGSFQILWQVTRDIESHFPGDFEKRLHRAMEQIVNTTPKPMSNPLRIGSLRYISRLMGINESGKNLSSIQAAFNNIVSTTIKTNGTFQLKEGKKRKRTINDTFHLYDRVILMGEELPGGEMADCVYLMLGSWYLQNVNSHYVVPLDWRFYNQLSGTITTRMYEFLCIHFFVALEYGRKHHDMRYSQICDFFPLTKQYPLWKAKKQLKHAHESLVTAGYFAEVQWLPTNKRDDWTVRYVIGVRAQAEYERNKDEIKHVGVGKPVPIPPQRRKTKKLGKPQDDQPTAESKITQELDKRGISRKIASKLSKVHSEDYLRHKIEVLDWLIETGSHLVKENPAGFLRMAIEEDYTDPAKFIPQEERDRQALTAKLSKRREAWQHKLNEYRFELASTAEQKVYGFVMSWENRFKKENGRQPTPDEKAQKRAELMAQLPSLKNRQEHIFGKVLFKAKTKEEFEKEVKAMSKKVLSDHLKMEEEG